MASTIRVSIPIGFSHQLRLLDIAYKPGTEYVSIPIGFSHQLRLGAVVHLVQIFSEFQSLSGFLIS